MQEKHAEDKNDNRPQLSNARPVEVFTNQSKDWTLEKSSLIIPADVMAEDFDVRNVVACRTQLQTFRVSFSAGLELTGYLSMTM